MIEGDLNQIAGNRCFRKSDFESPSVIRLRH